MHNVELMGDERRTMDTKKRVSGLHRTATTSYPCFGQDLGEFRGSWSYRTYPIEFNINALWRYVLIAKVLLFFETGKLFATKAIKKQQFSC